MTSVQLLSIAIEAFLFGAAYLIVCVFLADLHANFRLLKSENRLYITLEKYKTASVDCVVSHAKSHKDEDIYGDYYQMLIDETELFMGCDGPIIYSQHLRVQHTNKIVNMESGKQAWLKSRGDTGSVANG